MSEFTALTPTERCVLFSLREKSPQTLDELLAATGNSSKPYLRNALRILVLQNLVEVRDKTFELKVVR